MADAVTPKLGLVKPEVGASRDSWGGKLNGNWDTLDNAYTSPAAVLAAIKTVDGASSGLDADLLDGQDGSYYLAWGNFTGKPVTFPPTLPIAESDVTNLVADLAAKLPAATYTAADVLGKIKTVDGAGSGLDADLLDGNDASAFATAASLAGYLLKSGGIMTGALTLAADPASAMQAATKQYVDAKPAGAVISDTPPATPSQGQTWWESDTGAFYISYNDGNTTQWVQINGAAAPVVNEAPVDGNEYVRVNGVWRLAKQYFYPAPGSTFQNIVVPAAAKACRITGKFYFATAPGSVTLRMSADGSTFLSGASDYSYGGAYSVSGTNASPVKSATVSANCLPLTPTTDVSTIPSFCDVVIGVNKPAGGGVAFSSIAHGGAYYSPATHQYSISDWYGSGVAAALIALAQLPAFQLVTSGGTWGANTIITVEWMY